MDDGVIPFMGGGEVGQKFLSVTVAFEYGLSLIAPGGNVIPGTWVLDSEGSSHFLRNLSRPLVIDHLSNVKC